MTSPARLLVFALLLPLLGCGEAPSSQPDVPAADTPPATPQAELPPLQALNAKPLPAPAGAYSVLLVGHAYGHFRDRNRDLPSRTLTESIPALNALAPAFVALLGDNLGRPTAGAAEGLRSAFASQLDAPVFAVPGEHDLFKGGEHYESLLGPRYGRLDLGRELFILLDTGGAKGETALTGDQLAFFEDSVALAEQSPRIRNVVVLLHKVVWVRDPRYLKLARRINNDRKGPFFETMHPALARLAKDRRVLVGAGDVGHKSYSFVLDDHPDDGITYFATGLADRPTDSIARLDFAADGTVEVSAVPLTSAPLQPDASELAAFAAGTFAEPTTRAAAPAEENPK